MIDFHNHILPNVDDGSKSLEMSLNMLKEAKRQGLTDIVNTVHYQHPKVEGKDISFERMTQEIENLQKSCQHSTKSIKYVRERLDSTTMVIRYVCDDCRLSIGYPSKEETQNYLKQ